jgi:dTDP-4-amino-4,6-dideoxygalactose transaminase
VYHLFVIRSARRDEIQSQLNLAGIGCGLHYPVPLHFQKAYAGCGFEPGSFPITERAAAEILSLPMFPQLTAEQQLQVTARLRLACSPMRTSKQTVGTQRRQESVALQ